jgi:CRP-like cAMP-binding protein
MHTVPTPSLAHASRNKLLNNFSEPYYEEIVNQCKLINLQVGEVIYESSSDISSIYFPIDCIVSLIYETIEGKSSEIASIGNNGAVGCDIFLSDHPSCFRAVTTHPGRAYRMNKGLALAELGKAEAFHYHLLNFAHNLTTHISYNSICNRFHKIDQQFSKLLLLWNDWVSDDITLTQEAISHLIGVRREGITAAAHHLQNTGVIDYKRGRIHILDLQALEKHTCECYHAIKNALLFERQIECLPPTH